MEITGRQQSEMNSVFWVKCDTPASLSSFTFMSIIPHSLWSSHIGLSSLLSPLPPSLVNSYLDFIVFKPYISAGTTTPLYTCMKPVLFHCMARVKNVLPADSTLPLRWKVLCLGKHLMISFRQKVRTSRY